MEKSVNFESFGFGKRLSGMLKVDFKRMLKSRVFYILIACALVLPILMTVMMAMMDGSESVNQQTGEITIMEGPENAWQNIGTLPGGEDMGGMDVFGMCNINMVFMGVCVFVCLFISDDFRSGYAKNLFTVRAKKGEYVISKTLMGFLCGALMLIFYFAGSALGGAIAGLSFDLHGLSYVNLAMCLLSKIFLMLVFVSIFTLISVAAKKRTWLSICGSLGGGMLLFMMVSMISPLNATIVNAGLCLAGGVLFALGLGAISTLVLKKTSLV
ncbi:MAG: ABC transporter permease [Clostridia bacterium]|nr:ABC transporter permease [Clostridia bacterium]MBQ8236440.1 ABC transporter permease [Clostridia bacterium]